MTHVFTFSVALQQFDEFNSWSMMSSETGTYIGVRLVILTPMYFFIWDVLPEKWEKASVWLDRTQSWLGILRECLRLLYVDNSQKIIISINCCYSSIEPLACLSCDSARNCLILSEGMAKEIPAVTFSVLIPITSPSCEIQHTHTHMHE